MTMRIAVVDDDRDFQDMVRDFLSLSGWEARSFMESQDLLASLRRENPNLILLDIHLEEGGCGWELLGLLRLDPILHDVPVIVCSAAVLEMRDQEERLRELNAVPLEKPFDLDHLYELIEGSLRNSTGDAALAAG